MLTPDFGNSLFELIGAFFTWRNAYQLFKDKILRGVYWPTQFFFATWGLWNLFYYPSLEQWLSFYAGAILVIGNLLWCGLALRYKNA